MPSTLYRDAALADGRSPRLQVGVSLLVEDGRIRWIRPTGEEGQCPSGCEVVDADVDHRYGCPGPDCTATRCELPADDGSWRGLVHSGQMRIRHLDMVPSVHPEAYVAPTAVLSGQVRVGRGSCIMHGAVLAAEGGPVEIGDNCMIMENAVLRGTPQHPLIMGDHVLAGPHSHLTGCGISDEVFIATGARVFSGAQMGRASSVALGGTVHIGCVVPPLARIPIGWVAVGEPARMYPPGEEEAIRAGIAEVGGFLPFVFGIDEAADRREQMQAALLRYTTAIARQHRQDEVIPASEAIG